jgi:hypothetical protein
LPRPHCWIGGITRFSQAGVDLLARLRDGKDLPDSTDTGITGVKKEEATA